MFTAAQANAILDAYFADERFLSLHSASPGAAGSYAAEVPGGGTGYARQSLLGKLGAASGAVAAGSAPLTWMLTRVPAASRVKKLASETPALFVAFDLFVPERGNSLVEAPMSDAAYDAAKDRPITHKPAAVPAE